MKVYITHQGTIEALCKSNFSTAGSNGWSQSNIQLFLALVLIGYIHKVESWCKLLEYYCFPFFSHPLQTKMCHWWHFFYAFLFQNGQIIQYKWTNVFEFVLDGAKSDTLTSQHISYPNSWNTTSESMPIKLKFY